MIKVLDIRSEPKKLYFSIIISQEDYHKHYTGIYHVYPQDPRDIYIIGKKYS